MYVPGIQLRRHLAHFVWYLYRLNHEFISQRVGSVPNRLSFEMVRFHFESVLNRFTLKPVLSIAP